jgi:hypothetical protein
VTFETLLTEHRVVLAPGDGFGPSGAGRARLSLAVDDETLELGLERLAAAFCLVAFPARSQLFERRLAHRIPRHDRPRAPASSRTPTRCACRLPAAPSPRSASRARARRPRRRRPRRRPRRPGSGTVLPSSPCVISASPRPVERRSSFAPSRMIEPRAPARARLDRGRDRRRVLVAPRACACRATRGTSARSRPTRTSRPSTPSAS